MAPPTRQKDNKRIVKESNQRFGRWFGTGTGWPDVIVATMMGTLALQGAATVIRQAGSGLQSEARGPGAILSAMDSRRQPQVPVDGHRGGLRHG
jgi:hypothetical protein